MTASAPQLGQSEAQLLLAALHVEVTLQREVATVHDRMKQAVASGQASRLEGQLSEDADVLDRLENLSRQRGKILPRLFALGGVREGVGALERLIRRMPAAERPQLEEACATLRRVAKQVSTQTAALSHLIKHSIGVNQALVAGVFGTSAEPDVYGNRGSKKDLRHGAILNREL